MRRCVYTTLIGKYETLNEQPVAAASSFQFICLTDDPDLRSETWSVRCVAPVFGMDPIRSQRELKLRPHVHLAEFDGSLYIDNSVILREPPEKIFAECAGDAAFCLPLHSFRASVLDEFIAVAQAGLDDQARIFEQLNHYLLDCAQVLQQKPYWSAILLRDHRDAGVRAALDIWAAHVMRYSRRDQLSANVAFHQAGLQPTAICIDNYQSWFHAWPITEGRVRDVGMRSPSGSLRPPVMQLRELEQALSAQSERHQHKVAELEAAVAAAAAAAEAARLETAQVVESQKLEIQELAAHYEAVSAAESQKQRALKDDLAAHYEAVLAAESQKQQALKDDLAAHYEGALAEQATHHASLLASRSWRLALGISRCARPFLRAAGWVRRRRWL